MINLEKGIREERVIIDIIKKDGVYTSNILVIKERNSLIGNLKNFIRITTQNLKPVRDGFNVVNVEDKNEKILWAQPLVKGREEISSLSFENLLSDRIRERFNTSDKSLIFFNDKDKEVSILIETFGFGGYLDILKMVETKDYNDVKIFIFRGEYLTPSDDNYKPKEVMTLPQTDVRIAEIEYSRSAIVDQSNRSKIGVLTSFKNMINSLENIIGSKIKSYEFQTIEELESSNFFE